MIRWLFIIYTALLVGAIVSSADIIFEPAGVFLGTKWQAEVFDLDLNGDNTSDFRLTAGGFGSFAGLQNAKQNRYLIHPSPPPNIGGGVARLNSGYTIRQDNESGNSEAWFLHDLGWATIIQIFNTGIDGEFYHQRGFIGLEFEAIDGTHYGWLDIEGMQPTFENPQLNHSSLYIHGWAYETEPGKGIITGAIPEPSSLALLLAGAFGIWTLRKRKKC